MSIANEAQAAVEHDRWCDYPRWQFKPDEIVCDCHNARVIRWLATAYPEPRALDVQPPRYDRIEKRNGDDIA